MATNKHRLYHWTLATSLERILHEGLDPGMATGELYAIWGCEIRRVEWAKDHVANRHRWCEDELILLRVNVSSKRVYRTCWPGVFYTPEPILPKDIEWTYDGETWTSLPDWYNPALVRKPA